VTKEDFIRAFNDIFTSLKGDNIRKFRKKQQKISIYNNTFLNIAEVNEKIKQIENDEEMRRLSNNVFAKKKKKKKKQVFLAIPFS
jgi:hypothetical protein